MNITIDDLNNTDIITIKNICNEKNSEIIIEDGVITKIIDKEK